MRPVKSFRGAASDGRDRVIVGSKDFTESILLAEIVAQMLEAQNVTVDRRFDLGGNLAHTALTGGQIDLYPEYTGTAFTAILHHQPITDPKAVYDQVKREYAEQFNLEVSPPLGFDNTFAILVRGEDARKLNLKTVSDAARYSPQWQAGFGHDFISRQDGYPGFSRTYGLRFAQGQRDGAGSDLHRAVFAPGRSDCRKFNRRTHRGPRSGSTRRRPALLSAVRSCVRDPQGYASGRVCAATGVDGSLQKSSAARFPPTKCASSITKWMARSGTRKLSCGNGW